MTTTTEQSRSVVQGIYDAAGRSDFPTLLGLIAENVHVDTPPYLPWAGPYETRDEWLAKCVPMLGTVYDFPSLTVDHMIAEGDRVVVRVHQKTLESEDEVVHIESWKVKDGKAIEFSVFCFDPRPVYKRLEKIGTKA